MTTNISNVLWWITNPIDNNGVTSDPRDSLGDFPAAKNIHRRVDGPSEKSFRCEFTDGGLDDVPAGSHTLGVRTADRFTPTDLTKWPDPDTFYEGLWIVRDSFQEPTRLDHFTTRVLTYDNSTGQMTLLDPIPNGATANTRWAAYDPNNVDTATPSGPLFRTPTLAEFETGVTQYACIVFRPAQNPLTWLQPRAYLSFDDPGEAIIEIAMAGNSDPGGPLTATGQVPPIADDVTEPNLSHFNGTNNPGRFSAPTNYEFSDQPAQLTDTVPFANNRFIWLKRTLPPGFMPKEHAYVRLIMQSNPDDPQTELSPPDDVKSTMVISWSVPDFISGNLFLTRDRSVYIGGGAKITANVKPGGIAVADVPVTWELENISSPPVAGGSLSGTADSITDENGEAQVTYIAPTDKAVGDSPGPHVKVKART